MEVDDTIAISATNEKLMDVGIAEKMQQDDDEEQGEEEEEEEQDEKIEKAIKNEIVEHDVNINEETDTTEGNNQEDLTNLSSSPNKLEMSISDLEETPEEILQSPKTIIEDDEKVGSNLRRKSLTPSPAKREEEQLDAIEHNQAEMNGVEELEEISLKRRRYEVRKSGSDEYLLGFDEQSGEAELVKMEVDIAKNADEKNTAEQIQDITAKTPPAVVGVKELSSKANSYENAAVNKKSMSYTRSHAAKSTAPLKSSTPISAATVKRTPQSDYYRKPFEYGWKRELVWRANLEASKDKADVYFISPAGKKLRARGDIVPLLEGDLTIDHFCFVREPLGAGPELEIVRSAKPSSRLSATAATLAAAPSPTNIGKRISKPKGPKGASPPPQGWTPSQALKVNNAALLSSTNAAHRHSSTYQYHPSTSPSTRRIAAMEAPSHHNLQQTSIPITASHTTASTLSSSNSSKSSKIKKSITTVATTNKQQQQQQQQHVDISTNSPNNYAQPPTAANSSSIKNNLTISHKEMREPCSVTCIKAPGLVPLLQCIKCLCHYHHQCMGLSVQSTEYRTAYHAQGKDYVCENCTNKNLSKKLNTPPIRRSDVSGRFLPQTIAVVKGKKYVMVAKPLPSPSNQHVNDIENDLKQINESIKKHRKHSLETTKMTASSIVGSSNSNNAPLASSTDHINKMFASNFFANVSYAYDALLDILKYLTIHERSRAAAVCKLWNLAAKDTSLWHTVRMKNSKVCSWSGFTAALRRGETKHLDLRKMLLSSSRSEDMWLDFCQHIGTVCSLEIIDLCRCSARVVESLFLSNRNLRILNALAINDDSFNLENVGSLTNLEELRLRTCEAAALTGDLLPLATLNKLTHLSLTAVRGLGAKCVEILSELTGLKSLELGECGDFEDSFSKEVLPKLSNLQRLRMENGQQTNCCTLAVLEGVAQLPQLQQLELVNFDIKCGFDEKLNMCPHVTKLLIIPTYISQSATTNRIVLSAVQQMANTLKYFTWGVTVELLRVTALYVDQCEESTKKEKHHFDECIPVLKPVPGAAANDSDNENDTVTTILADMTTTNTESGEGEVPQIEILPLDKVETILAENLPQTKFTIVKVPYHLTCKQHLVE